MKILQVVHSISGHAGGPAKAVLGLSEALVRLGAEVSIFAIDHGLGENLNSIPYCQRGMSVRFFKREWPKSYLYSPSLKKELERSIRAFDVVHIHGIWLYPTWIASRICRREKIPYIIRPCGMLDQYCLSHHPVRKGLYYLLIERKNIKQAHTIHFTTEEERNRSKGYGHRSKTVVIPLGFRVAEYLNLPPRGEFRKRYPHFIGKKIILYLGRISFKKGLDLLVRAVEEVVKQVKDVHWVIAGPDDEGYGKKLRGWIEEKGFENQVTFLGLVEGDDQLALLRDSDIFCLPSHQENFGMAVVEAMAAGLPVVVSDQVNLYQEISSARAGLVTRCEAEEVRKALCRLLQDEELRREMGENGRRLVQARYPWDQIAQEVMRLYESIARCH